MRLKRNEFARFDCRKGRKCEPRSHVNLVHRKLCLLTQCRLLYPRDGPPMSSHTLHKRVPILNAGDRAFGVIPDPGYLSIDPPPEQPLTPQAVG
jgi:hypothetical protein